MPVDRGSRTGGPARGAGGAGPRGGGPSSGGFTLVELIVAVVILTVGLLGLAATTAYVVAQTEAAKLDTERAAALQAAIEEIRATPFESLTDGSDTIGRYVVDWRVQSLSSVARRVRVITTGPGSAGGSGGVPAISDEVVDTFVFTLVQN